MQQSKSRLQPRCQRSGWRRRKRERPGEILAAARVVLARRGADAMRMQDVADRAGIAKGTIYLYFSGKADLLSALKPAAQ